MRVAPELREVVNFGPIFRGKAGMEFVSFRMAHFCTQSIEIFYVSHALDYKTALHGMIFLARNMLYFGRPNLRKMSEELFTREIS